MKFAIVELQANYRNPCRSEKMKINNNHMTISELKETIDSIIASRPLANSFSLSIIKRHEERQGDQA